MLNWIFMGSPPFARTIVQALAEQYCQPTLVVTQTAKSAGRGQKVTASAVEEFARERNLPCLATENVNEPSMVERIRSEKPDLIAVAAFGQILKEGLLSVPRLFCLNVHASLLPTYRGAAPIQRAIWNGDKVSGVSVQRMVKKMDAGDILIKRELPIGVDDTSEDLTLKLAVLGAQCLYETVRNIDEGRYLLNPQEASLVTFAPKIKKEDAVIDWTVPAENIRNQIRALQPWPVCESVLGGKRLKIFRATVISPARRLDPGEIDTDHKSYLAVGCGNQTALGLTEVQQENRKKLNIQGFLAAYRGNFPFRRMGES